MKKGKTSFPGLLGTFFALTFSLLFVAACGGSNIAGVTPTHSAAAATSTEAVPPTQSTLSGSDSVPTTCPDIPAKVTKITNFSNGTSGFQPEEHNGSNGKVIELSSVNLSCGVILKVHTNLSGDPNLNDEMHHTVLLTSDILQHDFSDQWQFGCYTFFPASIAALDGQGYYLRPAAISAGYKNDVSGDYSGTETLVSKNVGRWTYSFVNIDQGGADDGFKASQIIAFSLGLTANQFANSFGGDFYIGACVIAHAWHSTSNPLDMPV